MVKFNKAKAYNTVNNPFLGDGREQYDVCYTTVYYKNDKPQTVRRSTFDNPPTDISLDEAVLITVVILTYHLINNDWEYLGTTHFNIEVED